MALPRSRERLDAEIADITCDMTQEIYKNPVLLYGTGRIIEQAFADALIAKANGGPIKHPWDGSRTISGAYETSYDMVKKVDAFLRAHPKLAHKQYGYQGERPEVDDLEEDAPQPVVYQSPEGQPEKISEVAMAGLIAARQAQTDRIKFDNAVKQYEKGLDCAKDYNYRRGEKNPRVKVAQHFADDDSNGEDTMNEALKEIKALADVGIVYAAERLKQETALVEKANKCSIM